MIIIFDFLKKQKLENNFSFFEFLEHSEKSETREKENLTVRDLGKLTNISYGSISMMENGERSITEENIRIFSKFFNVSTDYLLGLSDNPNPIDNNDLQLDEFEFALYGEVKELTEEQKQTILNMAKFLKDSNK